jgi:hypothetical protein
MLCDRFTVQCVLWNRFKKTYLFLSSCWLLCLFASNSILTMGMTVMELGSVDLHVDSLRPLMLVQFSSF